MKKFTFYCLLAISCTAIIYACKKSEVGPGSTDANRLPLSDQALAEFNKINKGYLVTNLSESLGLYDLSITYDEKGNPDRFAGYKVSYDNRNRLIKIQWGPQGNLPTYREWKYKDDSCQPASSNFYSGGVISEINNFTYNTSGELVQYKNSYHNPNASGEYTWTFTYNNKGNITSVAQDGISLPIFQAMAYDDKANLVGTNRWLKYLLLAPETGYFLYPYFLFSTNNPTKWGLNDAKNGFIYPNIESYYQYNQRNLVTKDSTVFLDPVNGNFTDVQTIEINRNKPGSTEKNLHLILADDTARVWVDSYRTFTKLGSNTIYTITGPCFLDDYYVFRSNGTFEFNEGGSKCKIGDPYVYAKGNWRLSEDNKTIKFTNVTGVGLNPSFNMKLILITKNNISISVKASEMYNHTTTEDTEFSTLSAK